MLHVQLDAWVYVRALVHSGTVLILAGTLAGCGFGFGGGGQLLGVGRVTLSSLVIILFCSVFYISVVEDALQSSGYLL